MRRELRDDVCRQVFLGLGLTVVFLGILTPASRADYWNEDAALPVATNLTTPVATPTPPLNAKEAEEGVEEFLGAVKQIPKEEKKPAPTSGPPSKQTMLKGEIDAQAIRAMYQKSQLEEAKRNIERAAKSTNPAERQVLLKDAQVKTDNAAFVIHSIVGPPAAAGAAQTGSNQYEGSGQKGGASGQGRLGEAFRQLQNVMGEVNDSESRTLDGATKRAKEEFKEGRAGAGGVALYKAATMLTPLDASKMSGAAVENGRLVLLYDGQKLRFPALDRQFLAIAIRSVYGGEGLVKGKLLAVEKNSVVLSTGADQYGDVVWKKEFLPGLSETIKPGDEVALDLGPGVGVLSLPEPSHDRVTYYGPLKGNILGQVVQEADMVFSMFWYGVDWKTGLPLKPAMLPGYISLIETELKQPVRPEPPARPQREKALNWWEDSAWWVWTPDEMSLQLVPQTSEFEFVKSSMKVTVWGVREENLRDGSIEDGAFLSQHYDDFARSFPVLTSLKEAAKTVAVVRWLKQNGVPLDLSWARSYPLTKVTTPDTLQRFSVYVHRDKSGKPRVEAP
jgi:hypothetical protein